MTVSPTARHEACRPLLLTGSLVGRVMEFDKDRCAGLKRWMQTLSDLPAIYLQNGPDHLESD